MQATFAYDGHIVNALQDSVSPARLQRYQMRAAGDAARALQLYMWNTALSEALYGPIQGLEITLRNKIDSGFAAQFGPNWYDAQSMGLLNQQLDHIARAKQFLHQLGRPLDPSRIVAELHLGFWVSLFGRRYENHLWRPHLRRLFVNAPQPFLRQDAHRALDEARLLRNRIAHHEAIFERPLRRDHGLVLTAIGWLCSATAAWVGHHSRFEETFAARPWTIAKTTPVGVA